MDHLARFVTGIIHFLVSFVRDRNSRFWSLLGITTAGYVLFIVALLVATAVHSTPGDLLAALQSREIQHSIFLSLLTCSLTALLSLIVAVPIGYLLARRNFFGKALMESILDIPIVLPPMVIGLCLLILFQTRLGGAVDAVIPFTYTVFGVVLAQFVIGAAFAIRTMRSTFPVERHRIPAVGSRGEQPSQTGEVAAAAVPRDSRRHLALRVDPDPPGRQVGREGYVKAGDSHRERGVDGLGLCQRAQRLADGKQVEDKGGKGRGPAHVLRRKREREGGRERMRQRLGLSIAGIFPQFCGRTWSHRGRTKTPIFTSEHKNFVSGITVKGTTRLTTTWAFSMRSAAVFGP